MSEEEIIKELKVLIGLEEFNRLSYKENKAIQGLLDLYNKEKEKNRQSKMRIVQLENEITARIEDVNKYFVSKDKIKEKIENYVIKSKHPLVNAQSRKEYTFGIRALQELLEERN